MDIEYEKGFGDGYKEGFNKACEPVVRAKMLENKPFIMLDPKTEYFTRPESMILNDMTDICNKHFEESRKRKLQRIQLDDLLKPVFLEIIIKFKKELGLCE